MWKRFSYTQFLDSSFGHPALALAAGQANEGVVRLLLQKEANTEEQCDGTGWTALHVAASHGHERCIQALLDHGATLSATDKEGPHPIAYYCSQGEARLYQNAS